MLIKDDRHSLSQIPHEHLEFDSRRSLGATQKAQEKTESMMREL
jgi:hypothetical protein